MRDFTEKKYRKLLMSIKEAGYEFQTLNEFLLDPALKCVILRQDVDAKAERSMSFAKIQSEYGIRSSFYFRIVAESWKENIIKKIHELSHEIGYHYEDLTTHNGDCIKAYESFTSNLEKLRQLSPVKTICMHGSPRSKWDSKDIWKVYNYYDLGISGEPYFDIDFDDVFYLTDTGRRWDGWSVSVRDKIPQQEEWIKNGWVFHSTDDIIDAFSECILPDRLMLTFHPQRWHNNIFLWMTELITQNIKNTIKKIIINRNRK